MGSGVGVGCVIEALCVWVEVERLASVLKAVVVASHEFYTTLREFAGLGLACRYAAKYT